MKRRWRVVGTSWHPDGRLVTVREMDRFRFKWFAEMARRRYDSAPLLAMSRALGLRFGYHIERVDGPTRFIEGRRADLIVWDDPVPPPVSKPGDRL